MKKCNFFVLSSLTTLLMALIAYAVLPESFTKTIANSLVSQALKSKEVRQRAEAISVRVRTDNAAGSGVIIGQEGNTYSVITNAHVINSTVPNEIVTIDGEIHAATVIHEGNSLEGNDLAVLTFKSSKNYQVASFAINPNLEENQRIYAVGFPEEMEGFYFTQGTLKLQAPKPFLGGYQIGYDVDVELGMSGGALFNHQGELIGINGLLKGPILNDAYTYLDGSKPFSEQIQSYRQLSFAVPIQTLVEVAPNLALIPKEWKTGLNLAAKVDNIAQQITVRIDSQNGVEGSGVIIGQEGNTYYVFTACHVVSDQYCQSGKVKANYTLVTPDGKTYALNSQNILLPQGIDAALLSFTSKKAYQVATIGRYNIPLLRKQLVFLSGFPEELKGSRKFTAGYRFQQDRGLHLTFKSIDLNVETSKYELVYTNLTKPGMNGGPILDSQGQVIGINTGQEGEWVSSTEELQLGYALGVPVTTLLAFASQKELNLNHWTISAQIPEPLTDNDLKILNKHPAFVVDIPPKAANENSWFNYGNQLWRLERDDEAISALKKATILNQNFAQAYYALGLVYLAQETTGKGPETKVKAVEAFDQAIARNPYSDLAAQAWYQKSFVLQDLEEYEQALAAIERGIEIEEDEFRFYNQRASLLDDLTRYQEAKEAYTKSLEIYPLGLTYLKRGYLHTGQLTESDQTMMKDVLAWQSTESGQAIKDFTKAIELGMIEGYSARAFAYWMLENYQAALADYNKAIELDSSNASNYMLRGSTYLTLKNYQAALADYDKVIELDPSKADNYLLRGNTYSSLENYPQAITDYNKAIELDPNNAEFYAQRSRFQFLNNQKKLAAQDMSEAIKLKPDNASYYQERGYARFALGDYQGALEDHNQAIKLKPDYAAAYSHRGFIYQTIFHDYSKAMADYTKSIEIQPKFGSAYCSRGNVRAILSDLKGALADYDRAISLMKDPAPDIDLLWRGQSLEFQSYLSARMFLGNVRKQLSDLKGALADYDRAISLMKDPAPDINLLWQGQSLEFQSYLSARMSLRDLSTDNTSVYALVYGSRGLVRMRLKDKEGALEDYHQAIKIDPKSPSSYEQRGDYYTQVNQPEKAKIDYNQARELYSQTIKTQPKSSQAYISRADIYTKLEDYEAAITDYATGINLNPNNPQFYMSRGMFYSQQLKDYEAAIKDLSKVIELRPKFFEGYAIRGTVYFELKNYEAAIQDFSSSIKLQPDNYNPYIVRGTAYANLQDYSQALNDYNKAVELAPGNPQVLGGRGQLRQQFKDYEGAIADFSSLIKLEPDNYNAYLARGNAYANLQDYSQALNDYDKAVELAPDNPQAYGGRINLYRRLNHYAEAMKDANKIFELIPNSPLAYFIRGTIYHVQDNYTAALSDYQLALSKDDKLAPAIVNIGLIKYEQGDTPGARQLWQKAVEIKGNLPEAQLALAAALYAQGQQDQALSMAKEALQAEGRLGELNYLKDNLWGKQMLKDAKILLENPQIQAFLSQ